MRSRQALHALVDALAQARVLTVGDIMIDRYVHGDVERISPEAPIPILSIRERTAMLGGAGNVARNLVALGARGRFVATVGDDGAAGEVRDLLNKLDGIEANLIVAPGRQTSIKTRYLSGNQQLMRADWETAAPLPPETGALILDAATDAIAECAVMVLSDYGKGVLSGDAAAALIDAARSSGKTVIVDPKGPDFGRYRGAHVLTPNRRELGEATGMGVADDDDIVAAARTLIANYGIDTVLVTRSRDGMTIVAGDGGVTHLGAEAREVFDVSGAGDTVVSALAAALAAGARLERAAELANVAAGIVVGKVGTAAAYASDITAALRHRDLSTAEAKVMAIEPALDRVELWRRQGLKVGFTNGCFDLLHPGHVSLLKQAREAGDRLVVGLNSDASARGLKGPERPVQTEAARATVLASLASVDMVVIFGEDTPRGLIESLRPDILVKGADWAMDEVVGAEFVQGYGGHVLLVELEEGHSTTATISRMAK